MELKPTNEGCRKLRELCKEQGLSIRMTAAMLGILTPTFQNIYQGKHLPRKEHVDLLEKHFGISPEDWNTPLQVGLTEDPRIPPTARAVIASLSEELKRAETEIKRLKKELKETKKK